MKNKRFAIVTGGAKGIGRTISEHLAADSWNLILSGRDQDALDFACAVISKKHSVTALPVRADLSSANGPKELFNQVASLKVTPQAFVGNAANYGKLGFFKDVDFESWRASFDLNFFSVAESVQLFLKSFPLKQGEDRKKVLLMSGGGLGASKLFPAMSAYAISKAAIYRFVECVNEEFYAQGVDINCLAPGAIKTGFTQQADEEAKRSGSDSLGELFKENNRVLETGGESPDIAGQMARLLLSAACDGISGRLISAKWDRKLLETPQEVVKNANLLRLRRIDNQLFGPIP